MYAEGYSDGYAAGVRAAKLTLRKPLPTEGKLIDHVHAKTVKRAEELELDLARSKMLDEYWRKQRQHQRGGLLKTTRCTNSSCENRRDNYDRYSNNVG